MLISRNSGLRFPVLLLILLLPGLTLFFAPLVLSTDSLYGFLAYKGTMQTGYFNVLAEVSPQDISHTKMEFVSWWSPGQWVVPGLIHYLTSASLGVSSIITTILFSAAGMLGYYRIFRHYAFSDRIITLSLLAIFFSSNFNYSYIVYQGGEILSFGIFPWFLLFAARMQRPTPGSLIALTLFFLACFVAKTTMIFYCSLVLLYKLVEPCFHPAAAGEKFRLPSARHYLYGLPVIASAILVYFLFLARGPIPTVVSGVGISAEDVFIPLSSPVTALFSVQTAIASAGRYLQVHGANSRLIIAGIYFVCTIITFWGGRYLLKNKAFNPEYRRIVLLLYAGLCLFFIFSYVMNTNIDYSTRHMKLLAFLCIPVLLMAVQRLTGAGIFYSALAGIALLNIVYFTRLRLKLTNDRFVSVQNFYRRNDKVEETDKLDEESYKKIIALSKQYRESRYRVLFFIEAKQDVEIDIPEPCVALDPRSPILAAVYRGSGPLVIACVSKDSLVQDPGLLSRRLPDCGPFRQIDETAAYRFLIAGEKGQ